MGGLDDLQVSASAFFQGFGHTVDPNHPTDLRL